MQPLTVSKAKRLRVLRRDGACCAFTLIEVLVVVGVIAVLLSMLFPALTKAQGRIKSLKCSSNLRTIGLEFQMFAEGHNPGGQGDSSSLGGGQFQIGDFQDYLYGIDEFWDAEGRSTAELRASRQPVMCPAGSAELRKREGYPCGNQAITPPEDVTLAANMRLYRRVVSFNGQQLLAPAASTRLRSNVLSHPYAPLFMDVDGAKAVRRGLEPFYTAPPLSDDDNTPYGDGAYWMPATRHDGFTNVIFIGGHVLSSRHPESESWDWSFQGSGR